MFVGGAALCLAVAFGMAVKNQPARLNDAALVGQQFFPDFADPTQATGLQVAAYDKEAAKPSVFKVERTDGLWKIPSHHSYPADGQDQLAKTAASVVGIERGVYAGKTADDQKRMGVLDPLDDKIVGTEGRGSRITLYQDGKGIVDLIVGNKTDEAGNVYYVRKADENRVYRAELAGLKVSTKFAEWIEPDLLQIDRNKIVMLALDRYRVDEQSRRLVQGDVSLLTKDAGNPSAQWELDGLDPEKEKVKVATVSAMTAALDDLKIVGVRPKPPGLAGLLAGKEGAGLSQIDEVLMQQAGYFLRPTDNGTELVSNEGEVLAGTDDGIRYTLRFGEVISGSELEIEVGSAAAGDTTEKLVDSAVEQGEANAEGELKKDGEDPANSSLAKNRYLFVTAQFDESLLGERPAAPVKPVPPTAAPAATPTEPPAGEATPPVDSTSDTGAGDSEQDPLDAAAEEAEGEAPAAGDPAADPTAAEPAAAEPAAEPAAETQPAAETATESTSSPADAVTDPAATPPAEQPAAPDPQQEFEAAQKAYEADLAVYEQKTKEFEKKVADGQKRAQELTERFAPWYYVISADLFSRLKVERTELVEPPTPPAATPGAGSNTPSGLPQGFNFPGQPVTPPEPEPVTTPESEPAAEPETPADAATSDAPVEEAAKPADPPPSTDAPADTALPE